MPVKKRTIMAVILLVIAVVVIGSAAAVVTLQNNGAKGKVALYVKDAPAEWSHINVTFSTVEIHGTNASGTGPGWHNLTLASTHSIDLAVLVNVSDLLAQANVPAGNYTQIRIMVTNVTGVMTTGAKVNFTVPSGELKTNHPFNVNGGATTKLTVDMDISRSIVHAGGKWLFTPVLGFVEQG